MSLRHCYLALAAFTLVAGATAVSPASATSPLIANGDYPYWKLNMAEYDTTYAAVDVRARRFASFRWDSAIYCRYRMGWQGPGTYHVGTRLKTRFGWDAGYPWQGPGVAEDHDDDKTMADYRADYARIYARAPVCDPVRHHRHRRHEIVLRRKD